MSTETINFCAFDRSESLEPRNERVAHEGLDLQLAQQIRDSLRSQGHRIALTEAEQFAEADARMRRQA